MINIKTRILNNIEKYFFIILSIICVFIYNIFLSNFIVFLFNVKKFEDDKLEIFLKDNFNKLYEQNKCSIFNKVHFYSKIIKFLFILWLNNHTNKKETKTINIFNKFINNKQKLII